MQSYVLLGSGNMRPLEASDWRRDDLEARFVAGTVDTAYPGYGHDFRPVFVDKGGLTATELEQGHSPPGALELPGHLSPYLRCMLSVATRLQITPDNQVNKASLVVELRDTWKQMRGEDASKPDLEHMATFLREPESKAGRGTRRLILKK